MIVAMDRDGHDVASTAERIAERLRERILEGELRPGATLREVALAAELETSRNTLRESLRLLAARGLVTQTPNRGAAVRTLTLEDVRDIYCARRVVETQAATESAVADEASFGAMEVAVAASEQAEQARSWRAAETASLRFHEALVASLGSRRLDEFFRSLLAQLRLAWAESTDEETFQRSWAERDRELYELLRRGRRTQSLGTLLIYLDDSEKQTLDVLRRVRTEGSTGARHSLDPAGHPQCEEIPTDMRREGPQVGALNVWNRHNPREHLWAHAVIHPD